jgi:hypothetical protein
LFHFNSDFGEFADLSRSSEMQIAIWENPEPSKTVGGGISIMNSTFWRRRQSLSARHRVAEAVGGRAAGHFTPVFCTDPF